MRHFKYLKSAPAFLLFAAALLVAVLSGCGNSAGTTELEGTWTGCELVEGAEAGTVVRECGWTMEVRGDRINVTDPDETELYSGTFTLNENEDPKEIDITIESSNYPGVQEGQTAYGIYKIEGDTVTSAAAAPGTVDRPDNFDVIKDDGIRVFEFTSD